MSRKKLDHEPTLVDGVIHAYLWYPRASGPHCVRAIEVDLMDVRAADGLLITYDFDRDGWVIKQASTFRWEEGDSVCDPDWQEVAFVQAWGREKNPDEPPA